MAVLPTSVGVYCRLSYLDDGTEERVDRQESDCRELAHRLAWPISERHIFKDPNRSAWRRDRKRPGWEKMLAAIEAGEIDAVIVYHGDRLIRQPFDLEKLINIADSKSIRIASPTGTRNLDSPDDRYILRIEAAGFCRASDDTSRRVLRGRKAAAAKGLPRPGGTRAFGFERDNITIRKDEAAIIAEAAERLLAGQTMYSVVKWANERSVTTAGKRWRVNVFRNMLQRPRIAGLLERDGQLLPAVWDPIVERQAWEDIRALLAEKAKHSNYAPTAAEYAVRYLLTGIARCDTCGSAMGVQWRSGKNRHQLRTYLCSNSGCSYRVGRSVANLDRYVEGRVLQVLNDPDFLSDVFSGDADAGVLTEVAELERRKARAREQLENLADLDEEVDAGLLMRSLASFDRKITELRERRASSSRQRLLARMAGISREDWDETALDIRRATVAALFTLTVLPATWKGNGFDPKALRLERIELDD